jgi:lipopolysaccharide/colanic/teichoic acid biosynthesis glycosyltransferase
MTSVELLARVGTDLRATSLDQMPSILHVPRGEPPLVGPGQMSIGRHGSTRCGMVSASR